MIFDTSYYGIQYVSRVTTDLRARAPDRSFLNAQGQAPAFLEKMWKAEDPLGNSKRPSLQMKVESILIKSLSTTLTETTVAPTTLQNTLLYRFLS